VARCGKLWQVLGTGAKSFMRKSQAVSIAAFLAGIILVTLGASGQDKKDEASGHKIVHFSDLRWTPIMKGCELAPVAGESSVQGAQFVLRIRCVDVARIQAHWHPTDENVTVLKGTFLVGMGDKLDETKMLR
jgi:hypothetical protein